MAKAQRNKTVEKKTAETTGKAKTEEKGAPNTETGGTKTIFVRLPSRVADYGGAFYDSSSGTRIGGRDPIEVPDTLFVRSKIVDGELLLVSKPKEEGSSEEAEKPKTEEKTEGAG
jgi:hypothetical protein